MKLFIIALLLAACVDKTAGGLVTFRAAVAGPSDASNPMTFTNGHGFNVTLTRARLHVGAIYLNRSVPTAGAQPTSCVLPGIYVGEVTQKIENTVGLDVDMLSPALQFFAQKGEGTNDHASTGEVWLLGGDVNALTDSTVLLDVVGMAERNGTSYPFQGQLTIGANRIIPASDPSQPGAFPLCKQRIVTQIPIDLVLTGGDSLVVRVDPRAMFADVDFSQLTKVSDTPLLYQFNDRSDPGPDLALYTGMRAKVGVYTFEVQP